MEQSKIFADNMDFILGRNANMRHLVNEGKRHDIHIDYTYFLGIRRGTANASIKMYSMAVAILKLVEGYDWIEMWMMFVPDYFEKHKKNTLGCSGLSAEHFESMISELLVTASKLQFLNISEKQFEQLTELSRFIYKNQQAVAEKKPTEYSRLNVMEG